ncbi:hypothetical protein ACFCP7_10485 [Paenibacillus elgii]
MNRVPGMTEGPVYADKQITLHADYHIQDRIPVTIAPNTGDLDKGTILGVGTADGLYRPVRRAALTAAAASGATTATLNAADVAKFKQGDPVYLMKADGSGAFNAGTVSSISGNVVTFSTATTGAFAIGDLLFVKDGSETALLVLGDVVLDAAANKIASAFVSNKFLTSKLVGVDSIVIRDLKARVIPFGNNEQGQPESILVV